MSSAVRVEIIPTQGIVDRVRDALPTGSTVTVTCLPKHGLEKTVSASLSLADAGFDVIPHLAARQVPSADALASTLDRLGDAGVASLFLIGGDGSGAALPYADGSALLTAVRARAGARFSLGVAAYPDGHPLFGRREGINLLLAKQLEADFAVTQMCFDPAVAAGFLADARDAGVRMPVWLGAPAPVRPSRLIAIGAKIGVATSLSFARKGSTFRLLTGPAFDTAAFVRAVESELAGLGSASGGSRSVELRSLGDAWLSFAGTHVYSFNGLATVRDLAF